MLQLICVLISFLLMYTLKPIDDWADRDICNDIANEGADVEASACFGVSAVLRMTFALLIFHVLIIFLILPRGECSSVVHDGGWSIKFLIIFSLFIGFFWIPITFFKVWA